MKFAGLVSLALLLACSVGEKTVSGRPPDLAPFKTVEAEFIRWLFLTRATRNHLLTARNSRPGGSI